MTVALGLPAARRGELGRVQAESTPSLNIAGVVPFSSVDWPGQLAAVVFCQGCPWRCPYCHNFEILDPRATGPVEWDQVLELLQARRGLLDGVVFSGGEALMQSASGALPAAMRAAKNLGYKVGLHASGAYPSQLEKLLTAGLVDWVGLDVKALPGDYEVATGRSGGGEKAERSLAVLARHPEVEHEVRLTLWPGLLARRGVVEGGDLVDYALDVARWVKERGGASFALQAYRAPRGAEGAGVEIGWDADAALARLQEVGFGSVAVR